MKLPTYLNDVLHVTVTEVISIQIPFQKAVFNASLYLFSLKERNTQRVHVLCIYGTTSGIWIRIGDDDGQRMVDKNKL